MKTKKKEKEVMTFSDVDEASELSDLSEDEDYNPSPKRATTSKKKVSAPKRPKGSDYEIEPSLSAPRTTLYSARSLYEMILENAIDLDPPYQRDFVWQEHKQVGLIDSLLQNYYVPPLLFSVKKGKGGRQHRVCIDGKQRLTSIVRYFQGEVYHKDHITGKRYWFSSETGRKLVLPEHLRRDFSMKQITCIEYDSLNLDQERELFQRVQNGVALTPAERMRAISGPRPDLVRKVLAEILEHDGFAEYLGWGSAGGRDFQCLSSIIYLTQQGLSSAKFPTTTILDKWLQEPATVSLTVENRVMETFRTLMKIGNDENHYACFQEPRVITQVEYVLAGVLIFHLQDRMAVKQLCHEIAKMRAALGRWNPDGRSTTRVAKTMCNFIQKLRTEQSRDNVLIAAERKRKRIDSDDESDTGCRIATTSAKVPPAKKTPGRPRASTAATASATVAGTEKVASTRARSTVKKPASSVTARKAPAKVTKQSPIATPSEPSGTRIPKTKIPKKGTSIGEPTPDHTPSPLIPIKGLATLTNPPGSGDQPMDDCAPPTDHSMTTSRSEPSVPEPPRPSAAPEPKPDRLAALRNAKATSNLVRQTAYPTPPTAASSATPPPQYTGYSASSQSGSVPPVSAHQSLPQDLASLHIQSRRSSSATYDLPRISHPPDIGAPPVQQTATPPMSESATSMSAATLRHLNLNCEVPPDPRLRTSAANSAQSTPTSAAHPSPLPYNSNSTMPYPAQSSAARSPVVSQPIQQHQTWPQTGSDVAMKQQPVSPQLPPKPLDPPPPSLPRGPRSDSTLAVPVANHSLSRVTTSPDMGRQPLPRAPRADTYRPPPPASDYQRGSREFRDRDDRYIRRDYDKYRPY